MLGVELVDAVEVHHVREVPGAVMALRTWLSTAAAGGSNEAI